MSKHEDYSKEVAETFIEMLEAGTAPWQKPWDAGVVGTLHHNPKTEKDYLGLNQFYLDIVAWKKGYDDPRWLTLKQANELGAKINKGEKSSQIEYWKWPTHEDVERIMSKGELTEKDLRKLNPTPFFARVFNGEQIEGLEPYVAPEVDKDFSPIPKAETIVEGVGIPIHHSGSKAFYSSTEDKIKMPPREAFKSEADYYSVLFHEIGHATGHPSRLNRNMGIRGEKSRTREELRAEVSSYMVAKRTGLPHNPQNQASYVAGWIKDLKDDPREIFRACRDADLIQRWILEPDKRAELEKRQAQGKHKIQVQAPQAQEKQEEVMPSAEKIETKTHSERKDEQGRQKGEDEQMEAVYDFEDNKLRLYPSRRLTEEERERLKEQGMKWAPAQKCFYERWNAKREEAVLSIQGTEYVDYTQERADELAQRRESDKEQRFKGYAESRRKEAKEWSAKAMTAGFFGHGGQPILIGHHSEKRHRKDIEMFDIRMGNSSENRKKAKYWEERAKYTIGIHRVKDSTRKIRLRELKKDRENAIKHLEGAVPLEKIEDLEKREKVRGAMKRVERFIQHYGLRIIYEEKSLGISANKKQAVEQPKTPPKPTTPPKTLPEDSLWDAMQKMGLAPSEVIMDGEWHRVPAHDDKGDKKSGSYKAYCDGVPSGIIVNYKTGEQLKWRCDGQKLSKEEFLTLRVEAEARKEERDKEQKAKEEASAKKAYGIWNNAETAKDHPYLRQKGIEGHKNLIRMNEKTGQLFIPVYSSSDKLQSLQIIDNEGHKYFLEGGKMKEGMLTLKQEEQTGDYRPIGVSDNNNKTVVVAYTRQVDINETSEKTHDPIVIAEGYATAKSIHDATGLSCVVTFNAGNMPHVVKTIQERYPENEIVLAADDDRDTPEKKANREKVAKELGQPVKPFVSTGITKAEEAAKAVNGKIIVPSFTKGEKERGLTDFNDLASSRGKEEVRDQFADVLGLKKTRSKEPVLEM